MLVYACAVSLAPSFVFWTYLVSTPMLTLRAWCVRGVWVLNILVRHTIVSPCSVAIPYPLLFFFLVSVLMYLAVLGVYGGMRIWVWFVRML